MGGWLAEPERKSFKAKHNLPVLECYNHGAPEWYWEQFPQRRAVVGHSMVDREQLVRLAQEHGSENWDRLFRVCQDLQYGANIGCKGYPRTPTCSKNASSAFTFGEQVSDAIADWISKGFAAGPFEEHEVPAEAKVSGIMCREKPNGAVRIILNLSAPKGLSVNDGIDKYDYPASMSSTAKWLDVLEKVGKGAWICKVDWSDAYKHLHVRAEDLNLQWFSWLGKFFFELCLIFGASSSPGLYDRLAKTVLDLVIRIAQFPKDWVCQHLDDVAAACPRGSRLLEKFDRIYQEVAQQLGIRLAPRDDPDKAFAPSTHGIVFGVEYDTISWTWAIPREKLAKIADQIRKILSKDAERLDEIQSIVGRIVHVKPLIKDGRFHVNYLLELTTAATDPAELVQLGPGFKRQLYFWYVILCTCSGRASIPDPTAQLPCWALDCYTDAAGGSLDGPGRGLGAVIPALNWWVYMPWSRVVNNGSWLANGKKVSRKMAALELMGPLVALVTAATAVRGKQVRFWVDNSGACGIWRHGYSNSCKLASTVVTALATVAAGLGCRVDICKIARCSESFSILADALSKADFHKFKNCGGNQFAIEPAVVPLSMLKWCAKPFVDDNLGQRLLRDLAVTLPILGYND